MLLYNKGNQLYMYIYPHIPSLLRLPPTLPYIFLSPPHSVVFALLCGSWNSNSLTGFEVQYHILH